MTLLKSAAERVSRRDVRVNRAVTPTDELREEETGGTACVAAADKPSKAKVYQLGGQQSYKITGRQSCHREPFRVYIQQADHTLSAICSLLGASDGT